MKVAISTMGKFHHFDMARQLMRHGLDTAVFSGYPRFKLKAEGLPSGTVETFPWLHAAYQVDSVRNHCPPRLLASWEVWDRRFFGRHVAKRVADVHTLIGASGSAVEAARLAGSRGQRFVCDRGSAHIGYQDALLRDEAERWELPYLPIDARLIERELEEYALSDAITVPSQFAAQSFVDSGLPREKLCVVPYGVDLSRYGRVKTPPLEGFNVLFVGQVTLQKGIPYLLQAAQQLQSQAVVINIVGPYGQSFVDSMRAKGLAPTNVRYVGPLHGRALLEAMSQADVLVLPRVQDGFGMVMAQAMAAGCPVIATTNTGAPDLYRDGEHGYIIRPRDQGEIVDAVMKLRLDPDLRSEMSIAARKRISELGGWDRYGDELAHLILNGLEL